MAIAERELNSLSHFEEPRPYRWTREQFHQMGDAGLFEGQRIILIEGEILAMPPTGPSHQSTNDFAIERLRAAFGDGFYIRGHAPFNVGQATDPQPDIAVVRGKARDYSTAHPSEALLIIEISVSTLAYDRGDNASLYASAGIDDYWIANVEGRQVEVHRQPTPDADKRFGFGYAEVTIYQMGEAIAPLTKPGVHVAVADVLP